MHVKLDCGYFGRGNYKRFDLLKLLGDESDVYPIRLWAWMFEIALRGTTKDQDFALKGKFESAKQVEWAAQWNGEPGKLCKALLQVGLLDPDLGIHNWKLRGGSDLAGWLKRKQDRHAPRAAQTEPPPNDGTQAAAPPTNRSNSAEALLVAKWNGLKNGFPISEQAGVEKIQGYVARGVPLTAIDEAMCSGPTTNGKKLWEVLEPLCPQKPQAESGVDQFIRLKKLTGKMP